MYPEFNRHSTRTIALIHNDYYHNMGKQMRMPGFTTAPKWTDMPKSSLGQDSEERQRKMLSKKIVPRPRHRKEIMQISDRNRKKERKKKGKTVKKVVDNQVKETAKKKVVYDPFTTSEDNEVKETITPWSFGGNSFFENEP